MWCSIVAGVRDREGRSLILIGMKFNAWLILRNGRLCLLFLFLVPFNVCTFIGYFNAMYFSVGDEESLAWL